MRTRNKKLNETLEDDIQDETINITETQIKRHRNIRSSSRLTFIDEESKEDSEIENEENESDDIYIPDSPENEIEEEDSDLEQHLYGKSRKRRRMKSLNIQDSHTNLKSNRPKRRVGRKKRRASVSNVPPELAGVLGEANMLYASHQYDEAIVLLKDFIKKAPMIPDPYHTLGMIYEDRADRTKALQFFLIACTLTPQDPDLWKRVGRIAKEENMHEQALFCFKKACAADTKDQEALYAYAELCREANDHRRTAEVLRKLTNLLPNDLSLWIQIAEAYHCYGQEDEAIDALKECIEHAKTIQSVEISKYELNAVNMLADLYITLRKYREAILVIQNLHERFATFQESKSTDNSNEKEEQDDTNTNGLPLDIAVKYGICHLYENDEETAELMFQHLYVQDVEVFGDLFIDVADAYISLGEKDEIMEKNDKAISILEHLINRDDFTMDQIWIKYAICHDRLNRLDTAITFYEKAIAFQLLAAQSTEEIDTGSNEVDPEIVLRAMKVTRRNNEPQRGIEILEKSLPNAMRAPIRPYFTNQKASKDARKASQQARTRNQEQRISTLLNVTESGDELPDLDEFEGSDSDYIASEEDMPDEDETQDQNDVPIPPHDPSLSMDAMENGIRLKLLIEYGHLKKAAGFPDVFCQVGIPIILTSLNQTSCRLSCRVNAPDHTAIPVPKKMTEEEQSADGVSSRVPQDTIGSHVLQTEYLVDITDAVERDSFMGIVMRVSQQVLILHALTEVELYILILDVAQTLAENKKHVAAIELLTDVNTSDKITTPELRFEIRFLALILAMTTQEKRMAYECARLNIIEDVKSIPYWNLFARVIAISGAFSWHQKFLAKLLREDPESFPAIMLAGHQSSRWEVAALTVGELTLAHHQQPTNPLILFCIGLAFLSASMQRTVNDRQHTVAKAFAFLQQYERMRISSESKSFSGLDQEILQIECWYNLGRAHQQLGLFHLAIPMYEKVLRYFEIENEKKKQEIPKEYWIFREVAYNLSLIYRKSGAHDLARYLITKHLTL